MKAAIKETIQAGILLYTRIKTNGKKEKGKRAKKQKPSSAEVMRRNDEYARRDFSIKLHHNFGPGDLHVVFTYADDAPSQEQAKKNLTKLKRDLSKLYKKLGVELKWMEVTEYENKRIHHHFVLSAIPVEELTKIWPHGFVRPAWLDDTRRYEKLADYLLKETQKTFRNPDAFSKRRYHCSRTVKAPDVRVEEVSANQLFEPKPNKGYYIDADTIHKGINPVTDRPYIEFVQVALDEPRPYRRGKKRKYRKDHIPWTPEEEQQSLFQ